MNARGERSPAPGRASSHRIAYLDSLRGLAALSVAVLFHYQHFSSLAQPGGPPRAAAQSAAPQPENAPAATAPATPAGASAPAGGRGTSFNGQQPQTAVAPVRAGVTMLCPGKDGIAMAMLSGTALSCAP